jgi:prevent-host-death family protein
VATTNIADLKNHLSDFLRRVEQGEQIVVAKRNVPFALIAPLPKRRLNQTKLGCLPQSVTVGCDLTEPAMAETDWNMHTE